MHGDDSAGGVATTLHPDDLPVVRQALAATPAPLKYARIGPTYDQLEAVVQVLPPNTPLTEVHLVFDYVAKKHPAFELLNTRAALTAFDYIDKRAGQLTLAERTLLQSAPVQWRDEQMMELVGILISMFTRNLVVDHHQLLQNTGMHSVVSEARRAVQHNQGIPSQEFLGNLEVLHKLVVLYLWLSFRNPVAFYQRDAMTEIKALVEKAMEWCLLRISSANAPYKKFKIPFKKSFSAPKSSPDSMRPQAMRG